MDDKLSSIVTIGPPSGHSCPFGNTPWQLAATRIAVVFYPLSSICRFSRTMAATRWTIFASLLLLGLSGCRHGAAEPEAAKADEGAEKAAISVRVEPAQQRVMTESVNGLARCEALPGKIATLTPAIEGRVHEILACPSDEVEAGQAIIQLDATIARADLQEKLTNRDGLEASLRLLETPPRPEEQETHKLAVELAKVALAKADATVERLRPLRARGDIPEQQMFEAELAVKQAQLQLHTAESELTVLMLGPRPAAIDEAKSRIAAAEAAVNSAKAKVDLHTLRAPIAGVVDSINCRPGQTLSVGAAIGEIVDSRQLHAALWLPVASARRVRVGQEARLRAGGTNRPAASGQAKDVAPSESLSGCVGLINRIADPQTGNLLVRVLVENADNSLVVGETLEVTIVTARRENVLAVPAPAINDLGEGPVVHAVRQGKTALLHPRLGVKDAGWVEVLDTDLQPGEPVIVEGGYNLPAETAVKVEASPAEGDADKDP
jgi:HlyD family secretion protein